MLLLIAAALSGAAVVGLLHLKLRFARVPDVIGTPMSAEWLRHNQYQLTKFGPEQL